MQKNLGYMKETVGAMMTLRTNLGRQDLSTSDYNAVK
jgi:hypothetical protein